jgi:DNA-binding NtrC family response regulator
MRTLRSAPPTDRRTVLAASGGDDLVVPDVMRAGAAPSLNAPAASAAGVSLDQPLREARDQFERVYFEYHLARENYSMTRVADRAGLERTHLYRKLKQLGVELGRGGRRTPVADAVNEFAARDEGRADTDSL